MFELANPKRFMDLSGTLLPWVWGLAVVLLVSGLYLALFVAPADYQQGETVRIMFVHVPSAQMAMFAYGFMTVASGVGLIMKHPLADMAAKAAAPIDAGFTLLALATGSLWAAHVGHLVGLGRTANIGARLVFSLHRLHRPLGSDRRTTQSRKGRGGLGACRSDQPADH